jgi:hypothetical protein
MNGAHSPSPGLARLVLQRGAALCACAVLFAGLLWSGAAARPGFELRYDSILLPLLAGAYFLALARAPAAWITPGLMLLSTGLCGAVLSGVWASAVSDHSLMAGFFPLSDSSSYLDSSIRLWRDGELSSVMSRRPLTSALSAVLFFICHGNVRCVMAMIVFLVALALTLPVRELIRTHGWWAGFALFLALFLFYRRFIGTWLSEHTGLALGCVTFALLWRMAHGGWRSRRPLAAGLFLLALALCARAGAFFVLPALALWAGFGGRGAARFSFRSCALAGVAAAAGLGLNALVLHALGNPRAAVGNFSYVLYGLVHGGDWTQVLHDHPEVRQFPEIERNQAIYGYALQRISDHPSSLVAGAGRAYGHLLVPNEGPYCFVRFALQRGIREVAGFGPAAAGGGTVRRIAANPWPTLQIAANYATLYGLCLLALAGLFFLLRVRSPGSALLLWGIAGIVASAPFAPPWDADLMRVYAATMPFMLALPALGLAGLARRAVPSRPAASVDHETPDDRGLLVLALGLALLCLAPVLFRLRASPAPADNVVQAGQRTIWVLPGSRVGAEAMIASARRFMGVLALTQPRRAAELTAALAAGRPLALGYDVNARTMCHLVLDDVADGAAGDADPGPMLLAPVVPDAAEVIWWRATPVPADAPNGSRP